MRGMVTEDELPHSNNTIEIAILNRVLTLADRYGLKPYDFCAHVEYPGSSLEPSLQIDFGSRTPQFFEMIASIGMAREEWRLSGTARHLIDTLDAALSRAPRARSRS